MDEVYSKILDFIAHKPRSRGEVIDKLDSYNLKKSLKEEILKNLISNKYINDEEYIKTYLEGLIRSGKPISIRKIKENLIKHKISIEKYSTLLKFPEDFEKNNCIKQAEKKLKSLTKEKSMFVKKQKLKKYLYYKGYSLSIINSVVDFLL